MRDSGAVTIDEACAGTHLMDAFVAVNTPPCFVGLVPGFDKEGTINPG